MVFPMQPCPHGECGLSGGCRVGKGEALGECEAFEPAGAQPPRGGA